MEPRINRPEFGLDGRKAVVIGASRGIGRALALGLSLAGAEVGLTGREPESLTRVAGEIEAAQGRAVIRRIDVRDTPGLQAGVKACAEELGGLDILIYNAGYEQVRPSLEVTPEIWDAILETNLKGAFFAAQAGARLMSGSGGGAILTLCSLSSSVGIPTAAPYTSSKSGLLGLTRALAAEWAPLGIRVNGLAPGYFRTAMTDIFFRDRAWAEAMRAKIPQGRFGELQDLVGAAVYLCGPAAAYITGQMLTVDGGYLASI